MLLSAGYFRVRLTTLSPFDKVVGGICWAISVVGSADLELEILFEENANIGSRIKVADSIVKALVSMKCPVQLQSHQIQVCSLRFCV